MSPSLLISVPEEVSDAPCKVVLMIEPELFASGNIVVSIDKSILGSLANTLPFLQKSYTYEYYPKQIYVLRPYAIFCLGVIAGGLVSFSSCAPSRLG